MSRAVGSSRESCLCVSFSGVLGMILSLSYVGVHEDHHDHGWPCARTIVFQKKLLPDVCVFDQKCMSRVHESHGCRAAPCMNHGFCIGNGCQNLCFRREKTCRTRIFCTKTKVAATFSIAKTMVPTAGVSQPHLGLGVEPLSL